MKFILVLAQICLLIGLSTQSKHKLSLLKDKFGDVHFPLRAVALLQGPKIHGLVRFTEDLIPPRGIRQVTIRVDISGLPESNTTSLRGLHIHQFAVTGSFNNITQACGTTGGHFNPRNETHGLLDSKVRHIGDLGNVQVQLNGTIGETFTIDSSRVTLWGKHSIIGRSVVLHDIEDSGLPTANFGPRIACGTIGWSN